MSRPRLLLLTDAFDQRGGGEVVVGHLADALQDRWDVGVLTTTRGCDEVVDVGGLRVFRVHSAYHPRLRPLMSLVNPLVTPKVAAIVRRFRPRVVHAWNVHSHLSYDSLRLVRRAAIPVVVTYQDAQPFCYSKFKCWVDPAAPCTTGRPEGRGPVVVTTGRPEGRGPVVATARPNYRAEPRTCRSCRQHYWLFPPRNRLVRSYLRRWVSRGVSVSHALAGALAQNGIDGATVVHNGLPLADGALVRASGRRARARNGWGASARLLLTGGRLHFFKGQRQAVALFGRIARERPDARLVVLGDRGWFRDSLRDQAAGLGLADRVLFPGFLDRTAYYDALAAADLFLNLSMYLDPFPTVNLEAMASGVPVVGTCYGGTPEAVADGKTGYIVNPYDLDGVARRTLALLDDAALRDRLGEAGKRRVEREFAVDGMAGRYEAVYREVTEDRRRRTEDGGPRTKNAVLGPRSSVFGPPSS